LRKKKTATDVIQAVIAQYHYTPDLLYLKIKLEPLLLIKYKKLDNDTRGFFIQKIV